MSNLKLHVDLDLLLVVRFLVMELGYVLPETLGVLVQLRAYETGKRPCVLSMDIFFVRS